MTKLLSGILVAIFFAVAFLVLFLAYRNVPPTRGYAGSDINHIWNDGYQISQGLNPYSVVSAEDYAKKHKKRSTYLPGFYLIVAAGVLAGLDSFDAFMQVWRPLNLTLIFVTGALLFWAIWQSSRSWWLAGFGAAFWYLNRWTLGLLQQCQIDILAVLLLVGSLMMVSATVKTRSYILYGLSLCVKQIGIFLWPLYLIWAFHQQGWRAAMRAFLLIAFIPVLITLPFLLVDGHGFLNSILFSAQRTTRVYMHTQGLDEALLLTGFTTKLPMLGMFGLVYLLSYRKLVALPVAALLVMLVFIGFNSVLFKQYFVWPIALAVLCLGQILPGSRICAQNDKLG